jgi:hypothetical protein
MVVSLNQQIHKFYTLALNSHLRITKLAVPSPGHQLLLFPLAKVLILQVAVQSFHFRREVFPDNPTLSSVRGLPRPHPPLLSASADWWSLLVMWLFG